MACAPFPCTPGTYTVAKLPCFRLLRLAVGSSVTRPPSPADRVVKPDTLPFVVELPEPSASPGAGPGLPRVKPAPPTPDPRAVDWPREPAFVFFLPPVLEPLFVLPLLARPDDERLVEGRMPEIESFSLCNCWFATLRRDLASSEGGVEARKLTARC